MGFLPGRKSQQASAAVQSGRKQLPRPTNYIHSMDFISIHHTPPPAPKGTSVTEFQHLMTGKTDRTRIAEESCFCGFAILLLQRSIQLAMHCHATHTRSRRRCCELLQKWARSQCRRSAFGNGYCYASFCPSLRVGEKLPVQPKALLFNLEASSE